MLEERSLGLRAGPRAERAGPGGKRRGLAPGIRPREGGAGRWVGEGRAGRAGPGGGVWHPGQGLALGGRSPGPRGRGREPGRRGWRLTFTGHAVSSEPEARSACAQEATHGIMAGMMTDSPLQRPPTFVYICRRASLPTAALSGLLGPSSIP